MALVQITSATVLGDVVTVNGTVNGTEVSVTVWKSHLNTLATKTAKMAYVAGRLTATAPPTPATLDLVGAVTVAGGGVA